MDDQFEANEEKRPLYRVVRQVVYAPPGGSLHLRYEVGDETDLLEWGQEAIQNGLAIGFIELI